jgi:hypothetical protein
MHVLGRLNIHSTVLGGARWGPGGGVNDHIHVILIYLTCSYRLTIAEDMHAAAPPPPPAAALHVVSCGLSIRTNSWPAVYMHI